MKKWVLIALAILSYSTAIGNQVHKIGVRTDQFITLSLPDNIMDISISSGHYAAKVKGRYLLLKAKSTKAPNGSLFVRYGRERQGYVAEVSLSQKAPLLVPVLEEAPQVEVNEKLIFSKEQDYYDLGFRNSGILVMVTHVLHQEGATYVRIFVQNDRAIPCQLSLPTFEHLSRVRRLLLFSKYKGDIITPLYGPKKICLDAKGSEYFLFKLPTQGSHALRISFQEHDRETKHDVIIPKKIFCP